MAFFQSKPNLPTAEKAKVEFRLQQLAEGIGHERLQRPVLDPKKLLNLGQANDLSQVIALAGDHLSHDVSGLQLVIEPQELEKCGGGG